MRLNITLPLTWKRWKRSRRGAAGAYLRALLISAAVLVAGSIRCPAYGASAGGTGRLQDEAAAPAWDALSKTGSMPLAYAKEFRVDQYGEAYDLITVHDRFSFLLVEEGAGVPAGLPESVTVIRKPLAHIYAASSSCPDFFRQLGMLPCVTMTSTKEEDWTIPGIREAVSAEDMAYVGKYSAPDYEYILDEGCDLALENTMIYHAPEVSEMLERLQVPVLTEYSSYEEHPLGRLEWIRLYGLLTGTEDRADAFFKDQITRMEQILKEEEAPGEKTDVVFFYVGSNGTVNVRREDDYVTDMIAMAGGSYLLHDLMKDQGAQGSHSGSVSLQMESFYDAAKDADVLIYNGTLGEQLQSLEELKQKSPLLGDFRAVKSGRVYISRESLFQEVTGTCRMIEDFFHVIRQDGESDELTFLRKLT